MDRKLLILLNDYLENAMQLDSSDTLKVLDSKYSSIQDIHTEEEKQLVSKIHDMVAELLSMRDELKGDHKRIPRELSESEKAESEKVQKLLDLNLFTYFFQPIIRADTGEIYSYEALMRAEDVQGITPYHILKYAELSDRLDEVEEYTFLNILGMIRRNKELFGEKPVFINSIPSVRIPEEKAEEIGGMLADLSDNVVVEMTENTRFNDNELNEIKERYRRLNIKIAIDDFGTGYSNISNLLRYTPNFVKIDRSLLTDIHKDRKKRHFVREIIEFCHDNDILALAEGVETSEELRTVILLGIDLIQGFYTARPAPDVIPAIPYELRSEICLHRQELEDGKRTNVYHTEEKERIYLDRLADEGFTRIHIGNFSGGIITICGSQDIDTDIHIETAEGFSGKLILRDVCLSNAPERPCIDIGEKNNVTIALLGINRLKNSGIRVPRSSRLTLEGKGSICIDLANSEYYGIGNDMNSPHGELFFDQDGTVSVTGTSFSGVCIGSGLGGSIDIRRGRYDLKGNGSMNVCIGALHGDTNIDILGCDFHAEAGGAYSCGIGSLYGSSNVHILYSAVRCKTDSQQSAAIGTVHGDSSYLYAESANLVISVNADDLTAFGSLIGRSEVKIERSSVKVEAGGTNAYLFGGSGSPNSLTLTNADISAKITSDLNGCLNADENDINITGGRYRVNLNGTDYENDLLLIHK